MKKELTKRKLQSRESRKRIFDTAIRLINKKGFENVTIEEISTEAKVSIGLFYNYYPSKHHLVAEQFLVIDEWYKEIVERELRNVSGLERLLKFSGLQFKYIQYRMNKNFLRSILRSLIMTDKTGLITLNESRYLYAFLTETVTKAQERGELPKRVDTREIVSHLSILIRGMLYNCCLYEGDFNIQEVGLRIISAYLKGLNAEVDS